MNLDELRKMPLPKLKERAKEVTNLQGVMGMKKEELVEAIAKAEGISYETSQKDVTTISSIKQEIRALKKQREEILTSSQDRSQIERIRKKIRRLKRLTRKLAREAGRREVPKPTATAESAPAPSS
ncbi:MAG: Rho termination factor N-terminal domain-containing protein [Candidatus Binatia bacterium]